MIQILTDLSLEHKMSMMSAIDPETQTWVVADLYSKNLVQSLLLKKTKCLPEDAVLRANELWQKILKRHHPEVELASNQFVAIYVTEWLRQRDLAWAKHPGTPATLVKYIGELLPILCDENKIEIVREWLRENPDVLMRWGHWFELSVEAWLYFCDEKILSPFWVGAFLSTTDELAWPRDLIFDVGPDLNGTEIELIRLFAQKNNVSVIAPSAEWGARYRATLWPYEILAERSASGKNTAGISSGNKMTGQIDVHAKTQPRGPIERKLNCQRFTTQFAEVKSATAQVRTWLEQGVAPTSIAVLAANIESYWSALEPYLKQEGVRVQKDVVSMATSYPALGRWLARLSIECREVEFGHLEATVYSHDGSPPIEYEKFKQLFYNVYDEVDLDRELLVKKLYHFELNANDDLNRDEFFAWAIRYLFNESEAVERTVSTLLLECPKGMQLKVSSWVSYLTSLVAKAEVRIREGHDDGIYCGNFDGALNLDLKNVIFLGLSEGQLRESLDLSVSASDVKKIATDLGIYLDAPDNDYNEFLVHWLTEKINGEICFYFSSTDFSGEVQAPSLIWLQTTLKQQMQIEKISLAAATRWDELQAQPLETSLGLDKSRFVMQDLGQLELNLFQPPEQVRFSASQIEKYLVCPFQFAAEKIFYLSDLPNVDLDVDAMTSGRLLHALLDKLLEEPIHFQLTDEALVRVIEDIRSALALHTGDERLWHVKRQHYVNVAQKFLLFEKEWRKLHPELKTVAKELRIRGNLKLNDQLTVEVSGQIDRVDFAGESYAVIDYKSSAYGLHNYSSWVENDEIQLAFYAMAIESGLTELAPASVVGAFYFTLSNMMREKGFRLDNHDGRLFSIETRGRSKISEVALAELYQTMRAKIAEVVDHVLKGQFAPKPKDFNVCQTCSWRTLCRAPHLN